MPCLVDQGGEGAPTHPDLTLSTFDSQVVTAYFGLTRRDPIVTHTAQIVRSSRQGDAYHANIVAGFKIPSGDHVVLPTAFYFSPLTFGTEDSLHRLDFAWSGDKRTEGTLVALTVGEAKPYLGTAAVTLVDGKTSDPSLRFSRIAMGRIAGSAQAVARPVRDGNSLVLDSETFRINYRILRKVRSWRTAFSPWRTRASSRPALRTFTPSPSKASVSSKQKLGSACAASSRWIGRAP